jgi:A1 cistron-splicing factor AAR2
MAQMDNEFAKKLLYEGALLVCLDVPEGTEFGIDYNSWNVGPKFKGVKMIPPGFHFVFYAAVGRSGQTAPRTGFFQYFRQREIIVKKWGPTIEDLVDQVLSEEEMERLRAGKYIILKNHPCAVWLNCEFSMLDVENLDQNLGKYPYESLKKWVSLSGHVTESVMKQIEPVCKRISSLTEVPQECDTGDERGSGVGDARTVACDTALRFTPLPFRHFPAGASPAQITKLSMDKSEILEEIMARSTGLYLHEKCHLQGQSTLPKFL